jgi:hypothetical protein
MNQNIHERLWQSYESEFTELGSQSSTGQDLNDDSEVRDALYRALHKYSTLIEYSKSYAEHQIQQEGFRLLIHSLAIAQANILLSLEEQNPPDHRNWYMPVLYYETARRWAPSEGRSHFHLARVMLRSNRYLDALYHHVRNLVSEVPHGTMDDEQNLLGDLQTGIESEFYPNHKNWSTFNRLALNRVLTILTDETPLRNISTDSNFLKAFSDLLGTLFSDTSSQAQDSVMTTESAQLVRLMLLLIGCVHIDKDRGGRDSSDDGITHSFIVSLINCIIHRCLIILTSPILQRVLKQNFLQALLSPIIIVLSWLLQPQIVDSINGEVKNLCIQLCEMVYSALSREGVVEKACEILSDQDKVVLPEEVELAGFTGASAWRGMFQGPQILTQPNHSNGIAEGMYRIIRFCQFVQILGISSNTTTHAAENSVTIRHPLHDEEILKSIEVEDELASAMAFQSLDSITTGSISSEDVEEEEILIDDATKTSSPVAEIPSKSLRERVVVIDAANVAMRHGNRRFSSRGIKLCADYFLARNDRVVAFLPDYFLSQEFKGSIRRRRRQQKDGPAFIPDDAALLQDLVTSGLLVTTPSQDSDDMYCIHYARRHNAFVVTNDLFRDHVSDTDGSHSRKVELKIWLTVHRISYTWVGDEFLPNPNSIYERTSPNY